MWVWALLHNQRVKTHPVCTPVRFRVRANSPFSVGPQWATVSPSKNPGSASTSSPALRADAERRVSATWRTSRADSHIRKMSPGYGKWLSQELSTSSIQALTSATASSSDNVTPAEVAARLKSSAQCTCATTAGGHALSG